MGARQTPKATTDDERLGRVYVILPLAFFVLAALPYLALPIWWDEALTLGRHVVKGPAHILFGRYHSNNHVLLSLLLYYWMTICMDLFGLPVVFLRALPFVLSAATVFLAYLIGLRMTGSRAWGAVSAALVAGSHVFLSFSCQLRGYAPGCTFIAASLYSALRYHETQRRAEAVRTSLWMALSVATLPTDLLPAAVIGGWLAIDRALVRRKRDLRLLLLAAAPLWGLLLYVPRWGDVLVEARAGYGRPSHLSAIEHVVVANVVAWAPAVLLLAALGTAQLARGRRREADRNPPVFWPFVCLGLLLPVVGLLSFRNAPYPRVLVPFVPIWGALLTLGLSRLRVRRPTHLARAVVLGQLTYAAAFQLGYFTYASSAAVLLDRPQNLLIQFYTSPLLDPKCAVRTAKRLAAARHAALVIADDSDVHALAFYANQEGLRNLVFTEFFAHLWKTQPVRFSSMDPRRGLLFISRDRDRLRKQLDLLGVHFRGYEFGLLADCGYYKVFCLRKADRPQGRAAATR